MRTTLTLDDVFEAAAHLAHVSGERLGKVVSKLARRGLVPQMPATRRGRQRFPTFYVPRNAPVIPASSIQRVIDQNGLL